MNSPVPLAAPPSRFSKSLNILLLIFSLILSFVATEIAARILVKKPEVPSVSVHKKSENPALLYVPIPGVRVRAYKRMNRINSAGFRGREYPVEKVPGTTRIAFLGDSVVYGFGLNDEDGLPENLEHQFQKKNEKVEVLNLGVSGFETQQEVEFFKEVGLKFRPDVVLLGYTLNDSHYASWELDLFDSIPDAKVKNKQSSPYRRFLGFAYANSRLLYWMDKTLHLQQKVKELRSDELPIRWYLLDKYRAVKDPVDSEYRSLEAKVWQEAKTLGTSRAAVENFMDYLGFRCEKLDLYCSHWNLSYQAMQELKQLGDQYRFKIIAVIFPLMQELDKYPLMPVHDFLKEKFQGLGFEVIDTLPIAREIFDDKGRPGLSPDSIHWTAYGSRQAAGHLYRELSQFSEFHKK